MGCARDDGVHRSHGAAGTRYLFVGKLFERRPSYHLLGVLLFLQLGISAGSWALHSLAAQLQQQQQPPPGPGAQQQEGTPPELERSHPDVGAHTRKALRAAMLLQARAPRAPPGAPAWPVPCREPIPSQWQGCCTGRCAARALNSVPGGVQWLGSRTGLSWLHFDAAAVLQGGTA